MECFIESKAAIIIHSVWKLIAGGVSIIYQIGLYCSCSEKKRELKVIFRLLDHFTFVKKSFFFVVTVHSIIKQPTVHTHTNLMRHICMYRGV